MLQDRRHCTVLRKLHELYTTFPEASDLPRGEHVFTGRAHKETHSFH